MNRIPAYPPAVQRIVVAVVVVDHAQLGVVVFAAPADGLGDVAAGAFLSVGGVGVGGADAAGVAEDFRHVFGQQVYHVPSFCRASGRVAMGSVESHVMSHKLLRVVHVISKADLTN